MELRHFMDHRTLEHVRFGDSAELADDLATLVLEGKKTARAGQQWRDPKLKSGSSGWS
jgi:uncharacterized protein YhfF